MASVGTVEIDVVLNTSNLDRQLSSLNKLKNFSFTPKINIDKKGLEDLANNISIPFKFSENSYIQEIEKLRRKVEGVTLKPVVKTDVEINTSEADKKLNYFSKRNSKKIVKNVDIKANDSALQKTLTKINSVFSGKKTIEVDAVQNNQDIQDINAKLSDESIQKIKNQLSSQDFEIKTSTKKNSASQSNYSGNSSDRSNVKLLPLIISVVGGITTVVQGVDSLINITEKFYEYQKKSSVLGNIFAGIKNTISGFFNSAVEGAGYAVGMGIANKISEKFDLSSKFDDFFDNTTKKINEIIDKVNENFTELKKGEEKVDNSVNNQNKSSYKQDVDLPSIPDSTVNVNKTRNDRGKSENRNNFNVPITIENESKKSKQSTTATVNFGKNPNIKIEKNINIDIGKVANVRFKLPLVLGKALGRPPQPSLKIKFNEDAINEEINNFVDRLKGLIKNTGSSENINTSDYSNNNETDNNINESVAKSKRNKKKRKYNKKRNLSIDNDVIDVESVASPNESIYKLKSASPVPVLPQYSPVLPILPRVESEQLQPKIKQLESSKAPVLSGDLSSKVVKKLSLPSIILPKAQTDDIAKKLREEFTAKGLVQIAKSLGIKTKGQQRNIEPLSKLIAESASVPDIQNIVKILGDSVKRSSKKTGNSDIRPELKNQDVIIKYLKEANKQLNDRIKVYTLVRDDSIHRINEDINNYIKSIDEIIKTYKYEGKTGQSLGGLSSQFKAKQKALPGITSQKALMPSHTLKQSSEQNIKPSIDVLTEVGLEDYQKIFKGLGEQLGVEVNGLKLPDIKASTGLPDGVKAAYEELTNTVYLSQDAIDILNKGVADSIGELGENVVSEHLSFLVHELTHAFQAKTGEISLDSIGGDSVDIKLPSVGLAMDSQIESLADKSTNEYIKQLQHLNPGKSLKQLEKEYKKIISEVKKREKEAYTAQLELTGGIVKSFEEQVSQTEILPSFVASVDFNPSEIKEKIDSKTKPIKEKIDQYGNDEELKGAVKEVFNPSDYKGDIEDIVKAAKDFKPPTKSNKDGNKGVVARIKKSLKNLYEIPARNINKRREAVLDKLVVEVEERAKEIQAELPDTIDKDNVVFVVGGFAGKQGESSEGVAKLVEEKFQESYVVPVANKLFDTVATFDNAAAWIWEVVSKKVLRTNIVEGITPDAKELAAQAKAYADKYNVPVSSIGYSGGGFVVQDATDILNKMGIDAKGVGIANPQTGYLSKGRPNPNFQAYMAKDDPLGIAMSGLIKDDNIMSEGAGGTDIKKGAAGHNAENYIDDIELLQEITKYLNLTIKSTSNSVGFLGGIFNKIVKPIKNTGIAIKTTFKELKDADELIGSFVGSFGGFTDKIGDAIPALKPFIDIFKQGFSIFRGYKILEFFGSALIGLGKNSFEVTARFQSLSTVTTFLAGSTEKSIETFSFLRSEISRLSIDTEGAIKGWNKLAATTRGTVLEGDTTKAIFSGVAQAGAAFNLTSEEMEGSIVALSQIAGKGVVSMEELRGQLAERIPGAFQIAARSMGMTEQELNALIATGNLAATDFLPKFAKQLSMETAGSIENASKTAAASMTRFKNSITELQVNAGKPLIPVISIGLDVFSNTINIVSKNIGILSNVLMAFTGIALKGFIFETLKAIAVIFSQQIAVKGLAGIILLLKNVLQATLLKNLALFALQTVAIYAVIESVKFLYKAYDTFFGKLKTYDINENLSNSFEKAGKKTDELREKLGKLRGEIDKNGKPVVKAETNVSGIVQKQEAEIRKEGIFGGSAMKDAIRQNELIAAYFDDVKEKREAKALKESASIGEIKTLTNDVNNILSSSDLIIAKAKEKNDAIGRLTVQAKNAEGKNLEDIKKRIEILQTESQVELFNIGGKSLGLNNIDSTTENVTATITKLKSNLEETVSDKPRQVIIDQITKLEEYQKKLEVITNDIGNADTLTNFLVTISKIGSKFEQASSDTDKALIKIKTSINTNLKENLTKDFNAENNASLEQARSEIFATQEKLKASNQLIDDISNNLKTSGGEIDIYYKRFESLSLEKLRSQLEQTDDKDVARKSTLESLIKLREGENTTLDLQSTLQEQLLQQERERMRVGQEKLDRELNINKSKIDINDANNQSNAVHLQTIGGTSQDEIGLIDASNQLKSAQQKEVLRQQELAGVKKLQANKLISAKDYENKVRELTVQGAQNNLAILQAKLGEEQALRAKEVGKIQRQLEQAKVDSEAKQTDIGFNVERKGFGIQQNNLKEQVFTAKSDEVGKQLEYQKQIAEKSGDISKQEKISAEIYQNQLASLAVKQSLQTKSLELTQAQQRLEMQRSEMQAQVALLEAQSQVSQLEANKATAEEINIAQQTVDIRQKQVNFISEQRENLVEVQQLEKDNLAIQNETQKKDLERSRNLQVIEEDEKRISKEIEIAKSNNELRNKEIERSSQLLNSQLELYKVQSDYKKSELDFQTELANKVNNVSALETIKAISYADQVASLKVQNLAQTESLKLTQEQQRIQAEIDVLDAQATLRKLELNKGSAQDIELAKQQLDAAQQQLGNLEAIQSNERERVGIEQQSALKNLERQQYLEMQDLAVKKITASLEQQSKLFNAQQNVLQSVNELDKQRLDYQLELANRSGDINRVEQLKAEIYLQQREEILRQGDAQLKSLDITQKQNNIELERQKLMAQSLLLEAKANLEKGKLKGASGQELNDLQQYVTIQEQQLSGIQQLVSANQEVQSLEKQQLEIQQQTKLEQIDQQRQLELIDLQAQKITKSYELQQQQLDLNNSELERQSALVNAKSGLNDSVSNLEKQRLDFRMQLAEIAENEVQKQQIKQQLYEQELKSLAQRQAIERETLKIAQLKQNIDIKRQEIQAEIATLEAQANIEQAKARGAGESELAALYKVLALRMQQEKSVQADKVNLAQIQQLERQKLNVDQTAANENLQQQRILDQARTAKEQQQKNSKGGNIVDTGVNVPLNINIPPLKPLPIEEVKISKTDSDKKNEIIESMKVTATNVYINGTVSASSGQNVNIETQNSDLEKVKKIENEINKLAKESRLKAANAAMDDYINKWNSDAEKERIASGLSAEQATAGGYEQARLAREEAERIKADLASGKLKTTGAEGFKPQAIMTPLQKLQAELDAAQKAVDSSKNKPNKNTSNSQETEGGTNVNVENLVIVSSDPTGDARQVLNDLAASKGKC